MDTQSWEILEPRALQLESRTPLLECGTRLLEPGDLGTCICIHISWCVCDCYFDDMYIVVFARRISMHMSLNGQEHTYISIG
jgi:hypothetical protein